MLSFKPPIFRTDILSSQYRVCLTLECGEIISVRIGTRPRLLLSEKEDEKDVPRTHQESWERSRNRPEPTGFQSSVTNFLPLPCPVGHIVSQGSAPARLRRNQLREALLLR